LLPEPVTRPCSFCSITSSTRWLIPQERPTFMMIEAAVSLGVAM
jgi:hypothetical protein